MRIEKIESYLQQDDTLNKVIDELKDDFTQVEYHANNMKDNLTNNPEEAKKTLNKLTGLYIFLRTALAIAETEKKNREIAYYEKLRIEAGKENTKFTSSVAERQASNSVREYRRIRNIIQAYVESCEKAINSLQSLLRQMQEEMKLSGGKNE